MKLHIYVSSTIVDRSWCRASNFLVYKFSGGKEVINRQNKTMWEEEKIMGSVGPECRYRGDY